MKHLLAFLFCFIATASVAPAFELDFPLACTIGTNCWVQQFADHDAGAGAKDYTCNGRTYDGHDGTDIRSRDTAQKLDVLAAADGVVMGLRDGVADRLARTAEDRKAIAGIECGNGVVIAHDGGYETQYCHMRQGSLAVKKGQHVVHGMKLGEVGFSGDAAFPHLHLSLRRNGEKLDPFQGTLASPCSDPDSSLWSAAAQKQFTPAPVDVLRWGWASGPVDLQALEQGAQPTANPQQDWAALVLYVWAINLVEDDEVSLTLTGPGGFEARNTAKLDRNKAQYLLFAGKKRPMQAWPAGDYKGQLTIRNSGTVRFETAIAATLR